MVEELGCGVTIGIFHRIYLDIDIIPTHNSYFHLSE